MKGLFSKCAGSVAVTVIVCVAQQNYMAHELRYQAIINEYLIPPAALEYQHEGSMTQCRNGDLINIWQASHKEGKKWGFAMMNRFDGEKWQKYPKVLDDGDNNYMPVPFQPKHAGAPLIAYLHLDGHYMATQTWVRTSTDNGHSWTDRRLTYKSNDSFFSGRKGSIGAALLTVPLELPNGDLLSNHVAKLSGNTYQGYMVRIPANNLTGDASGGDPWTIAKFNTSSQEFIPGPIMPISDNGQIDYSHLACHIGWPQGIGDVTYSTDGGTTWGPYVNSNAAGASHVHGTVLDVDGGPLKGWHVLARAGGMWSGRPRVYVNISSDGKNWTTALKIGEKHGDAGFPERAAQHCIQTEDRMLHVGVTGRGGKGVWHVVIDPDALINNTTPSGSGVVNICGPYRQAAESFEAKGGVPITVMRTGGKDGPASVSLRTVDGSAKAGSDFTATTHTFTWADGEDGGQTIMIPIIDDTDSEGYETFTVELHDASNVKLGGVSSMPCRITDDRGGDSEPGGIINFTHEEYFSHENCITSTLFPVIMRRRWTGGKGSVTVHYETRDGTAKAGEDYQAVAGTMEIKHQHIGEWEIEVPIINDNLAEGEETFSIEITGITSDSGAVIGTMSKATCRIIDDEQSSSTMSASFKCRSTDPSPRQIVHTRLNSRMLQIDYSLAHSALVQVALFNAAGAQVFAQPLGLNQHGRQSAMVDVQGLASGMYLLAIVGDGSVTGKSRSLLIVE
ncbi:MAG: hypothetical protein GF398_00555 [Chitinivibrionales bacterium]|nr:hypothetical protein [Chitinivibrionales bacterium]